MASQVELRLRGFNNALNCCIRFSFYCADQFILHPSQVSRKLYCMLMCVVEHFSSLNISNTHQPLVMSNSVIQHHCKLMLKFCVSGICFVGQQSTKSLLSLVLAPQFFYFALGVTFLIIGIAALLMPRPSAKIAMAASPAPMLNPVHQNPLIRNQKDPVEFQKRQKILVVRVGAFASIYALMVLCLTCCNFYEWWGRDSWLRAPEPSATPRSPSKPILQVGLLWLSMVYCVWQINFDGLFRSQRN